MDTLANGSSNDDKHAKQGVLSYDQQEPQLNDVDLGGKQSILRVLARGRIGLQRDEISILAETNGAEPMFMISALRAGLIKRCQQCVEATYPPQEKFVELLGLLKASASTSDAPYIRRIVEADMNEPDSEASNVVVLHSEERDRLTSFFVIHGAPALNVDTNTKDSFPKTYSTDNILSSKYVPTLTPQIPGWCFQAIRGDEGPETDAGSIPDRGVLSWDYVKVACASTLTRSELRWYFEEIWLPFCDAVTRPVAGITVDDEVYKGTIEIPNPFKEVCAHTSAARGLVETFLLHQRVILTMRFVIWNLSTELMSLLKGERGSLKCEKGSHYKSFPEWWCPWMHDIGILVGCLKHGYIASIAIRRDIDLPFTRANIAEYLHKSGFTGSDNDIDGHAALDSAHEKFPDAMDIERRIIYLLTEVTSNLANGHYAKLSSVFVQGESTNHAPPAKALVNSPDVVQRKKRKYVHKTSNSYNAAGWPEVQKESVPQCNVLQQQNWAQQDRMRALAQRYPQGLRPDSNAPLMMPELPASAQQMQHDARMQFQMQHHQAMQQQLTQQQMMHQQFAHQQALQRQMVHHQMAHQQPIPVSAQQYEQQMPHMESANMPVHGRFQGGYGGAPMAIGMPSPQHVPGQQHMPGANSSGVLGYMPYQSMNQPVGSMDPLARQQLYQHQHSYPSQVGYMPPGYMPRQIEAPPMRLPHNGMGSYQFPPSQR